REEQHRAEERRRLDAKRPPTERTTKPEPKPRPPAVRRRDDNPRVRMSSPTHQELRERARQRAKEEERSVRRRSDAEARAVARRRDDTDVAAREAAKQQQLRAIARQATLEREAQARAREARVAGRRSALAAKQRDERTAERRKRVVPRQRLPNGVLSGSLAWLGARGPLLVDEFDQPVVLRGATARWFERAEPTGQAYAAPLDDDDLELLQEWGATAVTIPIAQNLALEGRGDAPGTH